MIEIPLNSEPEQSFSIILGETTYDCVVMLNSRTGIWTISLSSLGINIVGGVSLLGGIDIFGQYNIGISNAYVINLENSSLDPDIDLGISAKIFILTEEEISNG